MLDTLSLLLETTEKSSGSKPLFCACAYGTPYRSGLKIDVTIFRTRTRVGGAVAGYF